MDTDLSKNNSITCKQYDINVEEALFADIQIGAQPDLMKVTHPAFAPNGKYYEKTHLSPSTDGRHSHSIKVPIARIGGCNFEEPDCEYHGELEQKLKKIQQGRLDNETFLNHKCPESTDMDSLTYKERVSSVHNTIHGHCNLQNTTAVAADDLSPGDDTDMFLFLLHRIMRFCQLEMMFSVNSDRLHSTRTHTRGMSTCSYNLYHTTDMLTSYTIRARKIIYYVCEVAPTSGLFDTLSLPDFVIFVLIPEFWHADYVITSSITWGPKLPKGADENDNKRFFYTYFQKPMLTVMRERGHLPEDLVSALTNAGDGENCMHVGMSRIYLVSFTQIYQRRSLCW